MIEAPRMIVPACFRNTDRGSHIVSRIDFNEGSLYGGSSRSSRAWGCGAGCVFHHPRHRQRDHDAEQVERRTSSGPEGTGTPQNRVGG